MPHSHGVGKKPKRRDSILKTRPSNVGFEDFNEPTKPNLRRRVSFHNVKTVQNFAVNDQSLLDGSPVKQKINETMGSDGVLTPGRSIKTPSDLQTDNLSYQIAHSSTVHTIMDMSINNSTIHKEITETNNTMAIFGTLPDDADSTMAMFTQKADTSGGCPMDISAMSNPVKFDLNATKLDPVNMSIDPSNLSSCENTMMMFSTANRTMNEKENSGMNITMDAENTMNMFRVPSSARSFLNKHEGPNETFMDENTMNMFPKASFDLTMNNTMAMFQNANATIPFSGDCDMDITVNPNNSTSPLKTDDLTSLPNCSPTAVEQPNVTQYNNLEMDISSMVDTRLSNAETANMVEKSPANVSVKKVSNVNSNLPLCISPPEPNHSLTKNYDADMDISAVAPQLSKPLFVKASVNTSKNLSHVSEKMSESCDGDMDISAVAPRPPMSASAKLGDNATTNLSRVSDKMSESCNGDMDISAVDAQPQKSSSEKLSSNTSKNLSRVSDKMFESCDGNMDISAVAPEPPKSSSAKLSSNATVNRPAVGNDNAKNSTRNFDGDMDISAVAPQPQEPLLSKSCTNISMNLTAARDNRTRDYSKVMDLDISTVNAQEQTESTSKSRSSIKSRESDVFFKEPNLNQSQAEKMDVSNADASIRTGKYQQRRSSIANLSTYEMNSTLGSTMGATRRSRYSMISESSIIEPFETPRDVSMIQTPCLNISQNSSIASMSDKLTSYLQNTRFHPHTSKVTYLESILGEDPYISELRNSVVEKLGELLENKKEKNTNEVSALLDQLKGINPEYVKAVKAMNGRKLNANERDALKSGILLAEAEWLRDRMNVALDLKLELTKRKEEIAPEIARETEYVKLCDGLSELELENEELEIKLKNFEGIDANRIADIRNEDNALRDEIENMKIEQHNLTMQILYYERNITANTKQLVDDTCKYIMAKMQEKQNSKARIMAIVKELEADLPDED